MASWLLHTQPLSFCIRYLGTLIPQYNPRQAKRLRAQNTGTTNGGGNTTNDANFRTARATTGRLRKADSNKDADGRLGHGRKGNRSVLTPLLNWVTCDVVMSTIVADRHLQLLPQVRQAARRTHQEAGDWLHMSTEKYNIHTRSSTQTT